MTQGQKHALFVWQLGIGFLITLFAGDLAGLVWFSFLTGLVCPWRPR